MPGTTRDRAPQPWMTADRPRRRRRVLRRLAALGLAVSVVGATAIWTDAFGAGDRWERVLERIDRFIAGPVPDRSSVPTIVITPRPTIEVTEPPTPPPNATPGPSPTVRPTPARVPVDRMFGPNPDSIFAHELKVTWCSPAGITIVVAFHGRATATEALQREIAGRVHEFESYDDSHNGGWGPSAMSEALAAYGVPGYEVRAYETREDALRDSAIAIEATGAPVVLLAWRGAHTWVMSGFRADADPRIFPDAIVTGAYILDPWYPDVSSIWGPSDPPGTFQDAAEMVRNFLPWKRPEGRYPDRDGRFIVLVPTIPIDLGD